MRGGDTSSAGRIIVSVTALGRSDRVPGRAGARPGDQLVVTGPLGAAGAAFRQGRYVRPPLRTEEGLRLGAVAGAMLDVSDGIAIDAGHLAHRSGCRLVIDLDAVPLAGELDDLGFGEDFELLAATPDPLGFPVIGRCEEGEGVAPAARAASRTTCRVTNTSSRANSAFSRTKLQLTVLGFVLRRLGMGDRALLRPDAVHVRPLLRHPGQQRDDPAWLPGRPGDDAARDGRDRRRLDRPRVRLVRLARRARRLRRLAAQPAAGARDDRTRRAGDALARPRRRARLAADRGPDRARLGACGRARCSIGAG